MRTREVIIASSNAISSNLPASPANVPATTNNYLLPRNKFARTPAVDQPIIIHSGLRSLVAV